MSDYVCPYCGEEIDECDWWDWEPDDDYETECLERANNAGHIHPLAEWGVTEAEALAYCYTHGFEWMERGVRLYDALDRVSCWCCRNKNLKELRAIHDQLPEYWERLVAMEEVLGPMKKGKTLPEIGAPC